MSTLIYIANLINLGLQCSLIELLVCNPVPCFGGFLSSSCLFCQFFLSSLTFGVGISCFLCARNTRYLLERSCTSFFVTIYFLDQVTPIIILDQFPIIWFWMHLLNNDAWAMTALSLIGFLIIKVLKCICWIITSIACIWWIILFLEALYFFLSSIGSLSSWRFGWRYEILNSCLNAVLKRASVKQIWFEPSLSSVLFRVVTVNNSFLILNFGLGSLEHFFYRGKYFSSAKQYEVWSF